MNRLVPFTLAWLLFALTVLCVRRPRHARAAAAVVPPVLAETVPVAEVAGSPPWDELPAPCCGTMPDLAHENCPGADSLGGEAYACPPVMGSAIESDGQPDHGWEVPGITGEAVRIPAGEGAGSVADPLEDTLRAELAAVDAWEPGWSPPALAALAQAPSCLDYEPDWLAARLAEGERWRARVAAMIGEAW